MGESPHSKGPESAVRAPTERLCQMFARLARSRAPVTFSDPAAYGIFENSGWVLTFPDL